METVATLGEMLLRRYPKKKSKDDDLFKLLDHRHKRGKGALKRIAAKQKLGKKNVGS